MLRDDQKQWLDKLSPDQRIKIVPHNPHSRHIFNQQKDILEALLGKGREILYRGASSLGISGQGDIDIYVPVPENRFDFYLAKLIQAFGEPGSISQKNRARFNRKEEGVRIEIMLVNNQSRDWKEEELFWNYLKKNLTVLKKYEQVKAAADGESQREYYRRKLEFINEVLEKAS